MKLEFDGHQDYQLEAIKAVIDIFDGQPLAKGNFETPLNSISIYTSFPKNC